MRRSSPIPPTPARSSPSPSRTSAIVGANDEDIETVNSPRRRGARGAIFRAEIGGPSNYRADAPARRLAEGARHHRPDRHRHPRAHRDDPRAGHAERGHRPQSRRRIRPRRACRRGGGLAGHRRHGPRALGHLGAALRLGPDELDARARLRQARPRRLPGRRGRLRHQAQHPAPAERLRLRGDGGAGDRLAPRRFSR